MGSMERLDTIDSIRGRKGPFVGDHGRKRIEFGGWYVVHDGGGSLSPDPPMSGRRRLDDGPEEMIDSVLARDRTLTWANAGRTAVDLVG